MPRTVRGRGMIWTAALILGALWGGVTAKRRGGRLADILQYAAVYAIALGLIGLAVSVVLDRLG